MLCFAAVRRQDIAQHRVWMMRGHTIGLGTGTQVLTYLPWLLFEGIRGELSGALLMGGQLGNKLRRGRMEHPQAAGSFSTHLLSHCFPSTMSPPRKADAPDIKP